MPVGPSSAATTAPEEPESTPEPLDVLPNEAVDLPAVITFAGAVPAAAWQTCAARLCCAVAMAAIVAFGWHMQLPLAPALQVLLVNATLLLTAAFQLQRNKAAYQRVQEQLRIRQLHVRSWAVLEVATALLGKPAMEAAKAVGVVGFAMYVDSGCYLAAVTVFHILARDSVRLDHIAAE
jgi:hypothetical protein